jgi:hypothetical protein
LPVLSGTTGFTESVRVTRTAAMTRESLYPYLRQRLWISATALDTRARQFAAAVNCNKGATCSLS